jgi:hypothetical protein
MVQQTPQRTPAGAGGGQGESFAKTHITKTALVLINAMVLVFIGFLSFVPLGEAEEYLIDPKVGVFLMIVLMLIMISSWVSKE